LALNYAKNFQKEDGTIVLIDSEFASEAEALSNLGLDTDNILYLPLSHIKDDVKEQSITYQLNEIFKDIERGEKVMIILDSLGALQTKNTLQNIEKNSTSMDMKIAMEKKAFMSFLTALVGQKGIPCLVLNHSYEAVGSFTGGQEVAGGGALYYPSTILLMGSKAQMKINDEVQGTLLRTQVYKGRLSREKAIGKWAMHYEHGILYSYGLDELALEGGYIEETKEGRSTVYKFGELSCPKKTYMLPEYNSFWESLLKDTDFGKYLNDVFAYGSNKKVKAIEVND
jgi:RecA/RadA recombinase